MSVQESSEQIAESQTSSTAVGASENRASDVGNNELSEIDQQPIDAKMPPNMMEESSGVQKIANNDGNLSSDQRSLSMLPVQVNEHKLAMAEREAPLEEPSPTAEGLSNQKILEEYDKTKDKARNHEKSKSDEGWSPGCQQVRHEDRERVKKLFVPSPDYKVRQEQGLKDIQLYRIYGPEHADKLRLAVHLGMTLTGEVSLLRNPVTAEDMYALHERRADILVRKFEQEFGFTHQQYLEVTSLRRRLDDNIHATRQHGDNRERESSRSEIIEQLHRIALLVFRLPFEKVGDTGADSVASSYRSLQICAAGKQEERSLIEYAQHAEIQDNTVYIIENGLQKGLAARDTSPEFITLLVKRKIAFIVTESHDEKPFDIDDNGVCAISSYPAGQLERHDFVQQCIEQYYKFYQGSIPRATGNVLPDLIGKFLQASDRIDNFFEQLIGQPPNISASAILDLADQIAESTPTHWHFATLSHNAKLYAMLVLLMENVPRLILDEIYINAVTTLREKGVSTLHDPREVGMNDILIEIRAYEGIDRLVTFREPLVAQEVDRQINNHYHLLWSLLETILQLIENFQARQYWAFRKALGAALGRFGMYRMEKLRPVLTTLALHSSGGVVAVAGYAMDKICRNAPDQQSEVVSILREWVDSKNPDLMWAVGASLWRIYDGLLEMSLRGNRLSIQQAQTTFNELNQIFTNFAETFDRFDEAIFEDIQQQYIQKSLPLQQARLIALNRQFTFSANNIDSILHAVRQIFALHPESIVAQINTWLNSQASPNQHFLGIQAGRQLFRENSQPDALLSERHLLSLLELFPTLTAGQEEINTISDTVDIVMQALLHWLNRHEWIEPIQAVLLRTLNRSAANVADLLCDSIARYWLDSDLPLANTIGQALLVRAYAIQGTPLDMPNCHQGLILLDAADNARANQEGIRTALTFYRRLVLRLDLYLQRMGDRQIQVTPDQAITVSDLQPYHPLPALMMPPLEASALPRLAFILALTWDQVHDAGDLAEGMANRLTVALFREQVVSSESLWPKQANVIVVQRDGTGQTAVDQAVNRMLAQALFKQAAAEWWAGVQPYFAAESVTLSANDAKAVIYQIESWILRLDQLAYNRYPNDLMRIIVHVVGWLAKVDFPLCIATLQQWLANADPQQRLVGAACGRFLFTLFMASKPPPDPYAQLLQVVPLLGQQNWDAAQTILQTAYRLSDDPAWRQRLLLQPSGAAGELMMMIDQTAATYHKPMTQLFERWTVAQSVADKEENKTARSGFVEQLRLRLALSSRQPLPGLLAESVYGLIVVDLAVRHGKKRRRLANMAAKIIEQLTAKLQQRPRSGFQLLTYWLGRDHPVAGPGEKPIAEQLMPTNGTTHPRLLGPLLERFTPQQIGFVFIVSDELPHDVEDWRNTELQRRLLLYADEPHSDWAAMCTVLSREDEEEDKTIGTITSYLLQRAGG